MDPLKLIKRLHKFPEIYEIPSKLHDEANLDHEVIVNAKRMCDLAELRSVIGLEIQVPVEIADEPENKNRCIYPTLSDSIVKCECGISGCSAGPHGIVTLACRLTSYESLQLDLIDEKLINIRFAIAVFEFFYCLRENLKGYISKYISEKNAVDILITKFDQSDADGLKFLLNKRLTLMTAIEESLYAISKLDLSEYVKAVALNMLSLRCEQNSEQATLIASVSESLRNANANIADFVNDKRRNRSLEKSQIDFSGWMGRRGTDSATQTESTWMQVRVKRFHGAEIPDRQKSHTEFVECVNVAFRYISGLTEHLAN